VCFLVVSVLFSVVVVVCLGVVCFWCLGFVWLCLVVCGCFFGGCLGVCWVWGVVVGGVVGGGGGGGMMPETYQLEYGSKHSADLILFFVASEFVEVERSSPCIEEAN